MPPHNSLLQPPMSTTRTWLPYFSPKIATAPLRRAWLMSMTCQATGRFSRTWRLIRRVHLLQLVAREAARIVEVEAGHVRRDQRALLLGALAQDVLEGAVQDVGQRVVAGRLGAVVVIDLRPGRRVAVPKRALLDRAEVRDVAVVDAAGVA